MLARTVHEDILKSFRCYSLWLFLGWNDILSRYKRTVIGPFWMVLSTAINVAALGVVSSSIFKFSFQEFFPYVAAGIISWTYICALITEGTATFTSQAPIIQNIPIPLFSFCLRIFVRNTIVFLHNLLILILILCFTTGFHFANLLLLPALLIIFINAFSVAAALGIICARFRDITQVVNSFLSIIVFITPILWKPEMLGSRRIIADINPFTHYIELLRAPLLGNIPSFFSLAVVLCLTILNLITAYFFFRKYRNRIAFWI